MSARISRQKMHRRGSRFAWHWSYTVTVTDPAVDLVSAPFGRRADPDGYGQPLAETHADTLSQARGLAKRIPGDVEETWR